MNHIDEGIVHAWLDGALDDAQSRAVEQHVAGCADCSARVAEARGLIAGASRVLSALDHVPAGVIPKRAAAPQRQWRAAPWVTGIAAALILAVGITTFQQKPRPDFVTPDATEPLAAVPLPSPVVPSPSPVDPSEARTESGASAPQRPGAPLDQSAPRVIGRAGDSSVATRLRNDTRAGAGAAAEVRQRESRALADQAETRKMEGGDIASGPPAAIAPPPPPPPAPVTATALRADVPREASANVVRLAGCYRNPATAQPERRGVAGPVSAAAGAAKASAGRMRGARVASPGAAQSEAAFSATAPNDIIRLDTLRQPAGYPIRSQRSDSIIGWWDALAPDSARADVLAAGTFTLRASTRIPCPEP